ncbi:hypothetical protein K4H28_10520 [Deefgea tanakiae]|uniref:MalT-like TPR region domain-containing protein n=1 Tax=Deefgea tanakiae TaxID=2865840 RepID=A0ABX8Z3A2_9NEIS|nr:hypothetical protein [Deefgea tanakiae]QZA76757.1 hypothetical protein K4H28_10520 [Deefgea tanakiae]
MTTDEFDQHLSLTRQAMFFEKCPELMSAAISLAQEIGYPQGQANALMARGEYLIDIGEQPSAACKDFRDAGFIARQLNNWSLLAQTLHWQAQSQLHLGEYMRALDIWLQALQTAVEAEDSRAFIRGYSGIAQVCLVFGQLEISLDYQRRALSLAESVNDPALVMECTLALVATCLRLQQFDEMRVLLSRLNIQLQITPHLENQAEYHIYSGLIFLHQDQVDEANDHLQLARVLAQQIGGLWCRSYAALILGQIYIRQNKILDAQLSLELCLKLGSQIKGFSMGQEAHLLLETLCAQAGDYQGALVHLEAAHLKQLQLLQKQAEQKLFRISKKLLNQLELDLRLELSRIRYSSNL